MAKNLVFVDDVDNSCGLASPQTQGDGLCADLEIRESDEATAKLVVCDVDGMHKADMDSQGDMLCNSTEDVTPVVGDKLIFCNGDGVGKASFCDFLAALPIV